MTVGKFLCIFNSKRKGPKRMKLADCVQIKPSGNPSICIIWLHGLGADGHDFVPLVPHLEINPKLRSWFIFPSAPEIEVTINNSMLMPAWYDILDMNIDREVDSNGIKKSINSINDLIEQVSLKIATERIILAGFSQGGVIAYGTAFSQNRKFGGVIGLSTYLPKNLELGHHKASRQTEILICHGIYDEVVPQELGREARDYFEQKNHKVQYNEYQMEHQVILPQCKHIGDWVNSLFSNLEIK